MMAKPKKAANIFLSVNKDWHSKLTLDHHDRALDQPPCRYLGAQNI